jgi:hypothetical protein
LEGKNWAKSIGVRRELDYKVVEELLEDGKFGN